MSEWSFQKGMSVQPFVHSLLAQAAEMGASDIHIEPLDRNVRVRVFVLMAYYRQSVIWKQRSVPLFQHASEVISYGYCQCGCPWMGGVSGKGKIICWMYGSVRCRLCGEKIVVSPVCRPSAVPSGRTDSLRAVERFCGISSGEAGDLFAAPGGSGKTTTLYALLELDSPLKSVLPHWKIL